MSWYLHCKTSTTGTTSTSAGEITRDFGYVGGTRVPALADPMTTHLVFRCQITARTHRRQNTWSARFERPVRARTRATYTMRLLCARSQIAR